MTDEPATVTVQVRRPTKFDLDELVELIRDGWSVSEASDVLSISHETIRKWLHITGTPLPTTTTDRQVAGGGIPTNLPDLTNPTGTPAGPKPEWDQKAACRDTFTTDADDPFHPNTSDQKSPSPAAAAAYETARSYCRRCPVTIDCLAAGLEYDGRNAYSRHGLWGGLTPHQRRRIDQKARPARLADQDRDTLRVVIGMVLEQADSTTAMAAAAPSPAYSIAEMVTAAAEYQLWRRGGRPSLDPDERTAYRAYCVTRRVGRRTA